MGLKLQNGMLSVCLQPQLPLTVSRGSIQRAGKEKFLLHLGAIPRASGIGILENRSYHTRQTVKPASHTYKDSPKNPPSPLIALPTLCR